MKKNARPGRSGKKLKLYKDKGRTEDPGRDHVFFSLADERYAVSIEFAQEILKPTEITGIPHTPDFMCGVVNLRGKIVPVIDLRLRFGLSPHGITKNTRIIVVQQQEQPIGLLVDSVLAVQPIADKKIEPAPDMISGAAHADFFQGIANLDNTVIIILDLEKTLKKPPRNLPATAAQRR